MYLKGLTISGFKSFAKKSELEFSVPITSIVGPNGSGKSNVAESFRFVLGEQSVKSMRGKKGEDLIWGGSTQVSRGNRASVTITLDNAKRNFPLDFDEIIIERTVHRDGQNEYSLNGSQVRLKDIHELLASANIGSTGHHIISQGEADRILSAGAKERREMIEDALGLKVYQYKKHEAERKLIKTLENVAQVESLRREAAPHLRYLEKQVQKIQKSLELQEKLKQVYAEYLRREDTYIAHHHDRLLTKKHEPENQLSEVLKEIQEAKNLLKQIETKNETPDLLKVKEEEVRIKTEERQKIERECSRCEGQIALLERRLEAHEKRANTNEGKAIPYVEMLKLVKDIEQQTSKVLSGDDVSRLKRALSDIVHRLKLFVERTEDVEDSSNEFDQDELERLQKELNQLTKELEEKKVLEVKVRSDYIEIEKKKVSDESDGREAERQVFHLISKQRELENEIERIDRELAILDRDRQEFKEQLQEAVALLGRAASQYYDYVVKNEEGKEVGTEEVINEDRSLQRQRRHELEKMKIRLEELGVGATDDAIKEYNDAKERDNFLVTEITDLESSIEKLRELIVDLNGKLEEQFSAGIEKISSEFNRFFTLMFGGGEAELVRVKAKGGTTDDLIEEGEVEEVKENGIELSVKLPNKRVKGLEMLSGGERALTSIALIFAMSQVNPPPFIILDETDAALDEANSRRYGDMIEELAKKSQLILITHNRETMSRAGVLYGVTMGGDGASKLLSVKFDEAVAVAK